MNEQEELELFREWLYNTTLDTVKQDEKELAESA